MDIVPLIQNGAIGGKGPADAVDLDPVSVTPLDDIAGIVAKVRAAHERHAARDLDERVKLLKKFADAILARGEDITQTLMRECGKVEVEARMVEVLPTADLYAFWGTEGANLFGTYEPELDALSYPGKRATVERIARGVIALITPWNFPVAIPLRTIFPALLAGNGVVMKPSEFTPRCAKAIEDAAREVYGEDLVRLVQGGGDVGAKLIASGVDAVVFTGSVATGRKVAHAAAEALIPVSLELGGKDAAIVLDDANLERAAQGLVWAAFANAGQNCAAVERVYAQKGIAGKLRERIVAITKELVPGRDIGPMATEAQLGIVSRHVDAAKADGATVLAGGERLDRPGLWYAPTVLDGAPSTAAVMTDESFGPILPIVEFDTEDDAVRLANSTRYGLTASVWTKNLSKGEKLARRLRAGVITVNNHSFTGAIPSLPWTGVGESGYGITNSTHAMDLLTRPRALLVDSSSAKRELWWYPYTPALSTIAKSMIELRRGGAGIGSKIRAVTSLLPAMMKRFK